MANLITEVYVSVDGLEFTKLDLHKDESIIMKYTQKDLQDISKIFAPYSQNFTFPATPKNRRAFGFFGDTTVIKVNTEKKYFCKIYSSGQLYQNGYLMLSSLSYKNNRPIDFTGSFANNITNLKDRIGEDTLNDLGSYLLQWIPSKVYQLISGTESFTIDGINYLYYVPLISNLRVWGFSQNQETGLLDNIAYDSNNSANGNNLIKSEELRPCLSFRTIFDLIKRKYNLDVIIPLEKRNEYNKLFAWCNNEKFTENNFQILDIKNSFGSLNAKGTKNEGDIPDPKKYTISTNLVSNTFRVTRIRNENEWSKVFNIYIGFNGLIFNGSLKDNYVIIESYRTGTNDLISSTKFDIPDNTNNFSCLNQFKDSLLISDEIELYFKYKFSNPTTWNFTNFEFNFSYYDGKYGPFNSKRYATYFYTSQNNDNSLNLSSTSVDLIKSLPPTKIIDFINSMIKSFNISIYDTSPNNNKLYWLIPTDVNTNGLVYSKTTLDYTPYFDVSEYKKNVPSEINYYNFKHQTSKYKSNIDYKIQFGLEFGQSVYPIVKPTNPKEFKVETNFSIIPPIYVNGSDEVITAYGFTADTPTLLDSGESRYTPNWNELTLFYNNGTISLNKYLAFKNQPVGGALINSIVNNYILSLPFLLSGDSFAFSILKFNNVEYPINLFSKYYQSQIIRYLDPNVLSQEYTLTLPASELYLNEATTIQGGGATPVGFRLQNDIIIGETKFSILDAPIDITTGKVKMTLLNY